MRWWLWALAAVTLVAAAAGVWFAAQSPTFVAGLTALAVGAAWKAVAPAVLRRMPPELEKQWRDCERRGGRWNHRTKRCE